MKRTLFTLCACAAVWAAQAQKTNFMPDVHGTVRAKYEYQPEMEAGRFQVRNARVGLEGKVHPIAGYKAEIDLSDEGKIKMLDAYVRLTPYNTSHFTIGQMRVPFTIDAHRSPHKQYFANRSFIAKQVGNVRDVGAMLGYTFWKDSRPLIIDAGVYNGSGLTNQKPWHSTLNYAAKAQFKAFKGFNLVLSTQSICPDSVNIRLYDVGMYYERAGWHVECEYLFKHYEKNAFSDVNAVNAFVNYDLPLKRAFRKISFLARYDYMSDHSDGTELGEAELLPTGGTSVRRFPVTDYARQRITGGVTFSLNLPFTADVRLNYEKYFYHSTGIPKESEQDKIVMEFMVHF